MVSEPTTAERAQPREAVARAEAVMTVRRGRDVVSGVFMILQG